ncbi:MAG TPA: 2-C-methyl-D-erythritol 4-phosphate cytidylyltransferase [Tepidisphaeraceae bacterium]|nr:2-C-methyl-D-erythritol 4-phosphate cytidylyltransferase [Tepidisphaeraceae bacterium]
MSTPAAAAPVFSVVVFTAPPPGQLLEVSGPYTKVDGREALLRSVELFLNRDNVAQVQLVIEQSQAEEAKRRFGGHLSFAGVKMITGGGRWLEQLNAALPTIAAECTHVIVHDAARPAVPFSDIDALMDAAREHKAVGLTAPVRATLVETDKDGCPQHYHLPDRFQQLLTPQAFARESFEALAKSEKEVPAAEAFLLKGSPLNVRVGGANDAGLVGAMLKMLPKPKIKAASSPFEEAQW